MKHFFTFCLCLASVFSMSAQSVSLFNVDASGFPTLKAKFYAFDAAGKQVTPSVSELLLTENAAQRTITSMLCPPPSRPTAISSVLTIDVSGSMSEGFPLNPNISLAKAAARAWIEGLPIGFSECALTSFDDKNYLNQDFTTDSSKLLKALSALTPNGGTDYNKGLLDPFAGSLQISNRGKYKKVVVFLSDGISNYNPKTSAIIAEAKNQNCIVYTVTLNMVCPQSLKDIASQTGGQWFENITTTSEAEAVYRLILHEVLDRAPCEIVWQSEPVCKGTNTNVQLTWQSLHSTKSYSTPSAGILSLQVVPSFVTFGKRVPLTQHDTTITLTALNSDFTVNSISKSFGSAEFSVVNTNFPLFIPKATSAQITIRFAPSDSGVQYASFEILTDKCPSYCSVYGGYPGKKTKPSTLKLNQPNGGEIYVVGSDTLITWTGISPSDTVVLEYSNDGGMSWNTITNKASGLQYQWKNVPAPTSNQCLVRVNQVDINSNRTITLDDKMYSVYSVAYSPDGTVVATGSEDGVPRIWDANTGALRRKMKDSSTIRAVAFSPDGSRISSACNNYSADVWDVNLGVLYHTLNRHSDKLTAITYSPDGSTIATGSIDKTLILWDANTGGFLRSIVGHTNTVSGVVFSPDGSKIASSSYDSTAIIWNASPVSIHKSLAGHQGIVTGVAFSPDGTNIATTGFDSTVIIWDASTGSVLKEFTGSCAYHGIAYSPDGNSIATAGADNTVHIWDATSGSLLQRLIGHKNKVQGVAFSPDGNKIASASADWTVKIWDANAVTLQDDVSDAVFTIVAPMAASQNVDMLKCLVGNGRDSVIAAFIENTGSYPYRVDSIHITGADASQFSIVSGIPPFSVPSGQKHPVEFHFAPISIGIKSAQIVIYTQAGVLQQTIQGEGVEHVLSIISDVIDFGKVEVGMQKDTIRVVTIKNIGPTPITINSTRHAGPNDINFSTLAGGGNLTLPQDSTVKLDLRFVPQSVGRTSGRLLFDYSGVGSPAIVQLYGEGTYNSRDTARTTVIAQDIIAKAGEKVNLSLKLFKPTRMDVVGAPTDWYARINYNKSILFNEQTSNVCPGTTDSCVLELTGVYNPKEDELISIPCIATLGNTDHSSLVIEEFRWTNSGIATDVATQNGTITITGTCEDGGVRLFIPAQNSTSLATRPNPAQDKLQIQYGLREPLTVTLELLTLTGQVVQTIVNNQAQAAGQYTVTSDLSLLGNGVYLLRLRTNKEMLTTRVDVVK